MDCHKSYGCSGCSGCSGYVAHGCTGCSGCHGGHRTGLFGGNGLFGGHGCKGGCHGGCHGTYVGCTGCTGGYQGYTGCTGGYVGCTGCQGGVIVMPAAPEKKPETVKPPKPEARSSAPATIIVSLPAEAKLSIDEAATTSTSAERTFVSPELPAGREFSYTLTATFQHEGKPVVVTKKVAIRAGLESRVTIGAADLTGVASR